MAQLLLGYGLKAEKKVKAPLDQSSRAAFLPHTNLAMFPSQNIDRWSKGDYVDITASDQ
jgi:hypothetical protein